jgi:pimeloyl-ACP methyl ester carboxylesterase
MASDARIKQRRLRLLDALHARSLEDAFLTSPEVRKQLYWEAERSKKHPNDALMTPESLRYLEDLIDEKLKRENPFYTTRDFEQGFGPNGPSNARLVPSVGRNGTVIIVPGNLCSLLYDVEDLRRLIWFNLLALLGKGILDLQLGPFDHSERDANPNVRIIAQGLIPMIFDLLTLSLQLHGFTPQIYPYDWRKDVDFPTVAMRLTTLIQCTYKTTKLPVNIVTHSLGGLVARRALQFLAAAVGPGPAAEMVGEVILIAPSTSGTFAGALGVAASVNQMPNSGMLPAAGKYVQPTTRSWTSLYQLFPWDQNLLPSLQLADHDVRQLSFWRGKADEARLEYALPPGGTPWASQVNSAYLADQTTVILGYVDGESNQTAGGVYWTSNASGYTLARDPAYDLPGDGFMAHCCSVVPNTSAYVACGVGHMGLPMNGDVIDAVISLLNDEPPTSLVKYDPNVPPCPGVGDLAEVDASVVSITLEKIRRVDVNLE